MSDPIEAKTVDLLRWWSLTELTETNEQLTPLSLATIVTDFVRDGAPPAAIDLEMLVD